MKLKDAARELLTRLGAVTPQRFVLFLRGGLRYVEVGRWMRSHRYAVPIRVDRRDELFALAASKVEGRKVLYLEFGVWRGDSMRAWMQLLRPDAVLHGFDSFEGLPETFTTSAHKGTFGTGGRPPAVGDPRVSFFTGWFEETLPTYRPPDHEALVINMDADLYSSTVFVLRSLRDWIRPGTLICFDEFHIAEHEQRAFDEFVAEAGLRFRVLAADRSLSHVLFECSGP
ncbi:MAG: TylF/MycF family methyltransferase [Chloroflexota bacterium]|nr:TylF/MycF family methyltransferase [Chloroflexota bacterium]